MPQIPLRLSDDLYADAKAKATRLGISLNALASVALDAYLRQGSNNTGGNPVIQPDAGCITPLPPPPTSPTGIEGLADPSPGPVGPLLNRAQRRAASRGKGKR